jgi:hypothetical protein
MTIFNQLLGDNGGIPGLDFVGIDYVTAGTQFPRSEYHKHGLHALEAFVV